VLLLMGVLMVSGIEKPVNVNRLGAVAKDRPADKAGLKEGDTILSVDGRPVGNFYEMLAVVRDQPGKPLRFTYVREGREATTTITPEADKAPSAVLDADLEPTGETRVQGKIGASPPVKKERLALGPAFKHAVVQPWMMASQLFGNFLKPATLQENVGGIATIAAYTDQAARRGLEPVFILAAMLSISLGIFNLLPIYPLDGGQMMVAVAEMFRGGRRLSMRVQNAVSTLGFAIICMLILFVLVVDARRFAGAKDSPSEKPAPAERAAEKPDK
ncbi:MAG TPA: M50 family metallopeptidase, partial [Fimbriimonadaceae bacterium]|nr:M50 family metallopeptidase [Fimbriimonadaceae bacterium]